MKTFVFLTAIVLLFNIESFSQIKVDKDGDVAVGQVIYTTGNSSSTRTLEIKSPNWDGGFVVDNSSVYGNSTFRPNRNWYGTLGNSSHQWAYAYIDRIHSRIVTNYEDDNMQENIKSIEQPLNKLMQLKGISYSLSQSFYSLADLYNSEDNVFPSTNMETNRIKDMEYKDKLKKGSTNQLGFLQEDLRNNFPELVFREGSGSQYSVNYLGLIPVMVEAIKEQQKQIEIQGQKILRLEEQLGKRTTKKKWFMRNRD